MQRAQGRHAARRLVNDRYLCSPMNPPNQQTDLNHVVRLLWRQKWIVITTLIVLPLATLALSLTIEKTYLSTVTVQVQPTPVDTTLFEGGGGSVTPQAGAITAAAKLIGTTSFAQVAARGLQDPPKDPRKLLAAIEATPDEEAGFIEIAATARNPQRAADIANAFADATVENRTQQARRRVARAISALSNELEETRGSKVTRDQLSEELQRLRALQAAQGNNAQIVELAIPNDSPASPKPLRNTALAVVLALILGIILAFLRENLDHRIRSPHELEEVTGLPLLTSVPESAFPDQETASGAEGEAFQTLRASLTYYNVDRPLRTIIVASPLKGDGKTTVATNLAVALARGGKRIILIDADLRRPQVASRLGVGSHEGLGAVLAGQVTADDALIDFHIADGGNLRVLPAGPPPPNPSELLNSERARTLIKELGDKADVVVIDSTPILPVSDVLPLLGEATGVVAVAKLGKTTRDSMRRFIEVVTMAQGTILGLVATNARAGGLYDGYGYGYSGGYEPYRAEVSRNGGEPTPAPEPSKSA